MCLIIKRHVQLVRRNGGIGSARGAYSQSFSAEHKSYRETSRLRPCSGQCTIVRFPNPLAPGSGSDIQMDVSWGLEHNGEKTKLACEL